MFYPEKTPVISRLDSLLCTSISPRNGLRIFLKCLETPQHYILFTLAVCIRKTLTLPYKA